MFGLYSFEVITTYENFALMKIQALTYNNPINTQRNNTETLNFSKPVILQNFRLPIFNKNQVSFTGMHMGDYIRDLDLLEDFGKEVLGKLPQTCKKHRKGALSQSVKYIRSEAFKENKIQGKNWIDEDEITWSMAYVDEAKKRKVNLQSPFFNVLEEPFDSNLLLSSLGIPMKNHKLEMKCTLGGMNPEKLDSDRQLRYTLLKNESTAGIYSKKAHSLVNPYSLKYDLKKAVEDLRGQKDFVEGTFKEEKFKGQYGERV